MSQRKRYDPQDGWDQETLEEFFTPPPKPPVTEVRSHRDHIENARFYYEYLNMMNIKEISKNIRSIRNGIWTVILFFLFNSLIIFSLIIFLIFVGGSNII